MFVEMNQLLQTAGMALALNVVSLGDGRLSVSVIPKGDFKNPALGTGMSVQGTAEELDAGLGEQINRYVAARRSLSEQVDATLQVIEAAKTASQKEAGTAISKATKASSTPAKPVGTAPVSAKPIAVEAGSVSTTEEIELF